MGTATRTLYLCLQHTQSSKMERVCALWPRACPALAMSARQAQSEKGKAGIVQCEKGTTLVAVKRSVSRRCCGACNAALKRRGCDGTAGAGYEYWGCIGQVLASIINLHRWWRWVCSKGSWHCRSLSGVARGLAGAVAGWWKDYQLCRRVWGIERNFGATSWSRTYRCQEQLEAYPGPLSEMRSQRSCRMRR